MAARQRVPVVLSVAGSDSGGGAGIQADLKACEANGAFGTTAIAALTAQNTAGVQDFIPIDVGFISKQMDSVISDFRPDVVKTGMLPTREIIAAVADKLVEYQVGVCVVDPVMVASSGDPLIDEDAIESLKTKLLPLATVVTPNLPEASKLLGRKISTVVEMEAAALELLQLGPKAVLLKGGHLPEDGVELVDLLAIVGGGCGSVHRFAGTRIATTNTHGTGCTLASTIAANLAKQVVANDVATASCSGGGGGGGAGGAGGSGGTVDLVQAVGDAISYLANVLRHSARLTIGNGANGPLNHQLAKWGGRLTQPVGDESCGGQFTAAMWAASIKSIEASERHPFLLAMVDGTLPLEQFQYYVKQDSLYLIEYARALRLLADGADHPSSAAMLRAFADGAEQAEQGLHRGFMDGWGLDPGADVEPSPNTVLYTSYLLNVVGTMSHAEGLAALLPCFWVYMHVGHKMLEARKAVAGATRPAEYDKWIDMYSGEAFEAGVVKYREMVEAVAHSADEHTRVRMRKHFKRACELEWMFWDAAANLQGWPV